MVARGRAAAVLDVSVVRWIRARDADLVASRRALRAAIVMPGLFAIGIEVIGNPTVSAFAAFGSFSMLLLASFGGPMLDRARAQITLILAGTVFVVLGTLVSTVDWLAALATALIAFGVLFAGVVSSVLASATPALLLAFILPVSLPGSAATIPDRLAGWGMASGAGLIAITLLWPAPARDGIRAAAIDACRAIAARLRAHVAMVLAPEPDPAEHEYARVRAQDAVGRLRRTFYASPNRPTGLSTATRLLVRLVDELSWLHAIPVASPGQVPSTPVDPTVCAVKLRAATVLERGADLLAATQPQPAPLAPELDALQQAVVEMERSATIELPAACVDCDAAELEQRFGVLIDALDPTFRSQELAFVTAQIGVNIDTVAAAEHRNWVARLLGRDPVRRTDALATAQERAASHINLQSVWLHNSLRGGIALGLAVLTAALIGAQHSFWVVLGALAVLRSNALSTGQNALRGMAGTVAGFAIGGVLVTLIGADTTVLWALLAPAVLIAGFAPAAISFAAGQGAFTVTLVILYNIIQPAGWRVGLVRVEDVALGCGVSLLVGLLFWPRGAAATLGDSLARAYGDCARYLSAAVAFGMGRCDAAMPALEVPRVDASRAAAASRRLDDTFRTYLAERGGKGLPLAEVTSLVTGVAGLRLAAEAVLDLWRRDEGETADRAAARHELVASAARVSEWYERLGVGLAGAGAIPEPLERARLIDGRLLEALDGDLSDGDHHASATAVRMIWTGDHLDAARRLQSTIVPAARRAAALRTLMRPRTGNLRLPWRLGAAGAPAEQPPPEIEPADAMVVESTI